MKKKWIKSICVCLMIMLAFGCCSVASFGATKTVKTKFYECYVKDGCAYCLTLNGIYKVNLKKETKKRLVKNNYNNYSEIVAMTVHKGKIYYEVMSPIKGDEGMYPYKVKNRIYRVKTSGKAKKKLATYYYDGDTFKLAISGKYIYYKGYSDKKCKKKISKRMNLNGKNKVNSKFKVKSVWKRSNNKNYWTDVEEVSDDCTKEYLYHETSSGKIEKIYLTTYHW